MRRRIDKVSMGSTMLYQRLGADNTKTLSRIALESG